MGTIFWISIGCGNNPFSGIGMDRDNNRQSVSEVQNAPGKESQTVISLGSDPGLFSLMPLSSGKECLDAAFNVPMFGGFFYFGESNPIDNQSRKRIWVSSDPS